MCILLLFVVYVRYRVARHAAVSQTFYPECKKEEKTNSQKGYHTNIIDHGAVYLCKMHLPIAHYNALWGGAFCIKSQLQSIFKCTYTGSHKYGPLVHLNILWSCDFMQNAPPHNAL